MERLQEIIGGKITMEIIMGIKRDQIIEGDGKETIGRSKRRE